MNDSIAELLGTCFAVGIFGFLLGGPLCAIICVGIIIYAYYISKRLDKK
jgi:hypothetical protein